MPEPTLEQVQQGLTGTRPSSISVPKLGGSLDFFSSTPLPTPNNLAALRQMRSDRAAQSEVRRGLGRMETIPGGMEEYESQLEELGPGTLDTLTTPIFDMLSAGTYASAGAVQEIQRGGTVWDAFKRSAMEFSNAMPFIEIEGAERPTFGKILSDTGMDPWSASAGGLVLDIIADPTTYIGNPAFKGIGKAFDLISGSKKVQAAKKMAIPMWLRKAFIPDVEIKDLGEVGDTYLHMKGLHAAQANQMFDTLQTTTTALMAGLAPEERRLMGMYLDQPGRLDNMIKSVGGANTEVLLEKGAAFRKYFKELFEEGTKVGLFDPAVQRQHYLAGRYPTTERMKKSWIAFAQERGIKSEADISEFLKALPPTNPQTASAAIDLAQGTPGIGAGSPMLSQGSAQFMKPKVFNTIEERILAGVPTELDIGMSTAQRSLEHVRWVTSRRFINAVLSDDKIATRVPEDFLPRLEEQVYKESLARKGYGVYRAKDVAYTLPIPIIKDLRVAENIMAGNEEAQGFFKMAGKLTSIWKSWALFSPGFHMRNMYSNWFNNYLGGLTPDKAHFYTDARKIQRGIDGVFVTKAGEKIEYKALLQEMKDQGVYKMPTYVHDMPRNVEKEFTGRFTEGRQAMPVAPASEVPDLGDAISRTIPQAVGATDPVTWRGVARELGPEGKIMELNRTVGSAIEDNARIAHYAFKRVNGLTPELAARSVKKYLFDYSNITPFERDVLKPVLPFYAWMRFNIPLQIEAMIRDPRKYSLFPKLKSEIENISDDWTDTPTPDYFQEITAVRLPEAVSTLFGGEPVYWNPGLPFQDLNKLSFTNAISQMNPFVKIAGEWTSGYSTFLDRDIERYPGELDPESPLGLSRKSEYFLQTLLPPYGKYISRPYKTYSRGHFEEQVLTEMAGIKLIGVDVEKVKRIKNLKKRDALRQSMEKLRDEGVVP